MRGLLDVNVLFALFDVDHVFHDRAHDWLEKNASLGIATCPLTENGVVRVISHQKYSASLRLAPWEVIERLSKFCEAQDHDFWPDEVSIRNPDIFTRDRILGSRQIMDVYLLGLAKTQGGRLVTFDEGIAISTVAEAVSENLVVI
ncbi:MAG: TA system VapC family ribonuclease toxin [Luteolibacter sp.]